MFYFYGTGKCDTLSIKGVLFSKVIICLHFLVISNINLTNLQKYKSSQKKLNLWRLIIEHSDLLFSLIVYLFPLGWTFFCQNILNFLPLNSECWCGIRSQQRGFLSSVWLAGKTTFFLNKLVHIMHHVSCCTKGIALAWSLLKLWLLPCCIVVYFFWDRMFWCSSFVESGRLQNGNILGGFTDGPGI